MAGISSNLHNQLRQALLDCGPFSEDRQLRAVFSHPLLRPWRDQLPQANTLQDRVDYTIDFLLERNTSAGANVLVIFLQVLSERIDPTDACHHHLGQLVQQLEATFSNRSSSPQSFIDSTTAHERAAFASGRMSKSSPGPIENRWALLIGINHYIDPGLAPLKFCVNDVVALEQMLKQYQYEVTVLHDKAVEERLNPTKVNIEAELIALCQAARPNDLLWVHFACHGQVVDSQPVLVVRDTRSHTLAKSGLSLAEVKEQMWTSRARRLVITLDACHVGVEIGRGGADPEFNRHVYDQAEGFALIAASTAQQKAQEWHEKEHGVFTYYLLEALNGQADRDQKQFITVDDLKKYTLDSLRRWNVRNGSLLQEPTAHTEGLGDMILADYRTV